MVVSPDSFQSAIISGSSHPFLQAVGDDQEDGLEGSETDLPINPSRSWEQFMNKNNKDELEDAQPEIEKDYNHATKSTGSDPWVTRGN